MKFEWNLGTFLFEMFTFLTEDDGALCELRFVLTDNLN